MDGRDFTSFRGSHNIIKIFYTQLTKNIVLNTYTHKKNIKINI